MAEPPVKTSAEAKLDDIQAKLQEALRISQAAEEALPREDQQVVDGPRVAAQAHHRAVTSGTTRRRRRRRRRRRMSGPMGVVSAVMPCRS